jgi:RNA polymerase sigma factor (TIGR02999 family)
VTREQEPNEATRLLRTLGGTESAPGEAVSRMFALVYDELRGIARNLMRAERPDSTLRPTALVHEAYIRLIEQEGVSWESRAHFFGIAGRAMRQLLVDHARERAALKRGGDLTRVTLDEVLVPGSVSEYDILDLDSALERLAALDPRASRVVEMRVFGGLSVQEVAHVLGVSKRTADDDWSMARMFLTRELSGGR